MHDKTKPACALQNQAAMIVTRLHKTSPCRTKPCACADVTEPSSLDRDQPAQNQPVHDRTKQPHLYPACMSPACARPNQPLQGLLPGEQNIWGSAAGCSPVRARSSDQAGKIKRHISTANLRDAMECGSMWHTFYFTSSLLWLWNISTTMASRAVSTVG
eukprot:scaffold99382_cov19-Tisochrysis_lutea.AAC.3